MDTAGAGFGVRSWDGVAVVTAPAEISAGNAQEFWDTLAPFTCSHAMVIVDMAATRSCSLGGLSALVMALRCAKASGATLGIVIGDPAVSEIFTATGTHRLFPMFDSLAGALGITRPHGS